MSPGAAPVAPGAPADAPVFREPWEAQAFAMALSLHERGLFTWTEWAEALGAEIAAAGSNAADDGRHYYRHWLGALERLVAEKGAGSPGEIERYRQAWQAAAARTRHGEPLQLRPEDFG